MTGKIFLSYRREDTAGFAHALFGRLEQWFPPESLFMDVEGGIGAGQDFVRVIEKQVGACDVMLVLIGPNWLTVTDEIGHLRLENPEDFVRVEVESALKFGKHVIPVLVHKTEMPRAHALPEPLKALARRNAVGLTHERFKADAQGLIKALEGALADAESTRREAATEAAAAEQRRAAEEELYQGRFGRMFRSLPAATYGATDAESRLALMALGEGMTSGFDGPKDGFDNEESGIPALYTYFGQFIDHDITFDRMTRLIQHKDLDAVTDFRTLALNLDNVYGRGPSDQPYLYEDDGMHFLLGGKLDNGAPDLPRNNANPARALIADPRNDENIIVSQLHALMLRFHNRVVDDHPALNFPSVRKIVRWHYQWVVVYDFLSRIVSASVLDALQTRGRYDQKKLQFYHWRNDPFMPVEFYVAAYRFGHSMVRPGYRLNDDDTTLMPIFAFPATAPSLIGFEAMAKNRGIDWGRFIDTAGPRAYGEDPDKVRPPTADMKKRLQFAYRIDTSVGSPLSFLPAAIASVKLPLLAQRNLLRGFELGLPTGQAVAKAMGAKPLTDDQIIIGKAVDVPGDGDVLGPISKLPQLSAFKGKCPLWTYILAEAAATQAKINIPVTPATTITTPQLGIVGGRIVAEVFLGMLFGDNDSFLSADPEWTPAIGNAKGRFALSDFVAYALGD